jgi:hypothetical protein
MTTEEKIEQREKLKIGFAIAYERMLEFKRYKKSKVVVFRDGKIVEIEP